MSFDITSMGSLRWCSGVSMESQQSVVTFFPTFYGALETDFHTAWMRVFPCDNLGSGGSSYVYIFRDCQTHWSTLGYVD